MQLFHALVGVRPQLIDLAELDRGSRARFRAGRLHSIFLPVVAERALPSAAVVGIAIDHAEQTPGDAVAAAVTDIRLDVDRVKLGADDGSRRAVLKASGTCAVLADIRSHQPREPTGFLPTERYRAFSEADVPPRGCSERHRIVIRHGGEVIPVVGQLVPLFAGNLASLAANAQRCVGEKAGCHRALYVCGPCREVGAWMR